MSNYMISMSTAGVTAGDVIHDPRRKLKVRAVNLFKNRFKPREGEVSFYVTAKGKETIAFETEGYQKHRQLHILQMISWYCVYLGLMEAQIHPEMPFA